MAKSLPTMRSLAAEAGVTPMTVSLALRNSPSISKATRQRIAKLAAARGYRPDPVINKLMHHLRSRATSRYRATIACLTSTIPGDRPNAGYYVGGIQRGIEDRARSLGYNVDLLAPDDFSPEQLQRILTSRGISGLILMPLRDPGRLSDAIDWRRFSVVSTTSSIDRPRFHRVIPNHFDNIREALGQLTRAGCRRIGLAISHDTDARVNHRWLAGLTWHNLLHSAGAVRPLIGEKPETPLVVGELLAWVAREQPDAVIVHPDADELAALATLPLRQRPKVVTVSGPMPKTFGGIDQRPEQIGRAAMEVLSGMMSRSETGIPSLANTTLIDGRWVKGRRSGSGAGVSG